MMQSGPDQQTVQLPAHTVTCVAVTPTVRCAVTHYDIEPDASLAATVEAATQVLASVDQPHSRRLSRGADSACAD
jgi:hypothetical protein